MSRGLGDVYKRQVGEDIALLLVIKLSMREVCLYESRISEKSKAFEVNEV